MDHEDGLFLSIPHKLLVNSLKDSRQQASLGMKAYSHHLTLIPMPLQIQFISRICLLAHLSLLALTTVILVIMKSH